MNSIQTLQALTHSTRNYLIRLINWTGIISTPVFSATTLICGLWLLLAKLSSRIFLCVILDIFKDVLSNPSHATLGGNSDLLTCFIEIVFQSVWSLSLNIHVLGPSGFFIISRIYWNLCLKLVPIVIFSRFGCNTSYRYRFWIFDSNIFLHEV